MTLSDAVFTRSSCRDFSPAPLSPIQRRQLEKAAEICSQRSGLRLQLVCDEPEPFSSLLKGWGRIKGARNYFLLTGPSGDQDLEEKCGFYGEELVLTAQTMGLATCWVGGTYNKKRCAARLAPEEELVCVIAVGSPAHPESPAAGRRPLKPLEELAPESEKIGRAHV